MPFKLLLLFLALSFLAATSTGQEDSRPKKKDLSWGVKADGLRISVWTNPGTDRVFGAVRNFSTKNICYCDPQANNFGVYVRKNAASEWQAVNFKVQQSEIVILALCYSATLKPDEEMPSYVLQKKNPYSFSLDLREYGFPADWSGAVEVKIVQYNVYCNKSKNKVGEVESPNVRIKLPFTGATAQS